MLYKTIIMAVASLSAMANSAAVTPDFPAGSISVVDCARGSACTVVVDQPADWLHFGASNNAVIRDGGVCPGDTATDFTQGSVGAVSSTVTLAANDTAAVKVVTMCMCVNGDKLEEGSGGTGVTCDPYDTDTASSYRHKVATINVIEPVVITGPTTVAFNEDCVKDVDCPLVVAQPKDWVHFKTANRAVLFEGEDCPIGSHTDGKTMKVESTSKYETDKMTLDIKPTAAQKATGKTWSVCLCVEGEHKITNGVIEMVTCKDYATAADAPLYKHLLGVVTLTDAGSTTTPAGDGSAIIAAPFLLIASLLALH